MKAKRLLKIVLPLVLVLAQAALVFASTEAGGEVHGADAEHAIGGHALHWGDFLWRVANFIIFVAIIWKFGGKKIVAFFTGRREEIETKLTDLSNRREDAEKRLQDVEQSIADLDNERQRILEEFKQQGEEQKAAIIAKAKQEAEKMREQAQRSAEQERRMALQNIRAELAEMVASDAEEKIKARLDKAEHEKLIDKYLTKVVPS